MQAPGLGRHGEFRDLSKPHATAVLLLLAAILSGACGRNNLGQGKGTPPDGGSGAAVGGLLLPWDPTAGCRENTTPDCSQCCTPGVDQHGKDLCNARRTNQSSSEAGLCPSSCPGCASCSVATEQALSDMAKHPRPECDCATLDPGNDPCFSPESCGCFCSALRSGLAMCPHLGSSVCSTGNHCGALVLASPGPYPPGGEIEAVWLNLDTRTVYLGSCGALVLERSTGPTSDAFVPCGAGQSEIALAPGQAWTWSTVAFPELAGGIFDLHGTYYLGCASGTPVGPANCKAGPSSSYAPVDLQSQ